MMFRESKEKLSGYRLHTVEVLNWGTFHKNVWRITPSARNALLTGGIGSGKSTLVDAITTLLVPNQKIIYNAAAGAQSKERTLKSYVEGAYKNQQDQQLNTNKSVVLRPKGNTYTAILAVFANEAADQYFTIAQVFWIQDNTVKRFFVTASQGLAIKSDFSGFGSDIKQLKKRLKASEGTNVYDTFKDYGRSFRQAFGIDSEKTLDLFYKTVSMKSIGDLTSFVQQQMLEKTEIKERIEKLKKHFENLRVLYESVQKARNQLKLLSPIVVEGAEFHKISTKIEKWEHYENALPSFLAQHEKALVERAIEENEQEQAVLETAIKQLVEELSNLRLQEAKINQAIWENGGKRLEEIEQEIRLKNESRKQKQQLATNYQKNADLVALSYPTEVAQFVSNLQQLDDLKTAQEEQLVHIQEQRDLLVIDRGERKQSLAQDEEELASLKGRKSQIPLRQVSIRNRIAEALEMEAALLPFVGELIKVKESEQEWEGAIERVLNGFALSMLVLEEDYPRVSRYINKTDLKGKLVFFRVQPDKVSLSAEIPHDKSLCHKVEIKPENPFEDWLEATIEKRFNLICADSLEEFNRMPYAITKNGLIRQRGGRHEKDDRHKLLDRKRYVLGWSNEEKIKVLKKAIKKQQEALTQCEDKMLLLKQDREAVAIKKVALHELTQITDYQQIDWEYVTREIQQLRQEQQALESSNDQLKSLKTQLEQVKTTIPEKEKLKTGKDIEKGGLIRQGANYQKQLAEAFKVINFLTVEEQEEYFPQLEKFTAKQVFRLHEMKSIQRTIQEQLSTKKTNQAIKLKTSRNRLTGLIGQFKQQFPAEAADIGATPEYLPELEKLYKTIKKDNLPKYENRFKEDLQKGAIREIVMLKTQLETDSGKITDKINRINESLKEIEYNIGTYICLVQEKTKDVEVRNFQVALRECLADTFGNEDTYNEEKYLKVKQILDRFNSEERADKQWTSKVTDVRRWFDFGASERLLETEEEVNFYSDSSGKSGGQKEKLAYTILASALAYQFGLSSQKKKNRSFRFVVIDEAFGKGSDDSTRYGLKLFKQLDLQLLIVTPLQKINVIEQFIDHVHFVSNREEKNSEVRNMTLSEYQAEKERYLAVDSGGI